MTVLAGTTGHFIPPFIFFLNYTDIKSKAVSRTWTKAQQQRYFLANVGVSLITASFSQLYHFGGEENKIPVHLREFNSLQYPLNIT